MVNDTGSKNQLARDKSRATQEEAKVGSGHNHRGVVMLISVALDEFPRNE
jgi:hypothetical protein